MSYVLMWQIIIEHMHLEKTKNSLANDWLDKKTMLEFFWSNHWRPVFATTSVVILFYSLMMIFMSIVHVILYFTVLFVCIYSRFSFIRKITFLEIKIWIIISFVSIQRSLEIDKFISLKMKTFLFKFFKFIKI